MGAGGAHAYLALSSLAYGYYRLAQQVAADPHADPALRSRLERWNELMAAAYEARPDDAPFRRAVRDAAADLHRRAPAVELSCVDAGGHATRCASTEALLRRLDRGRDAAGVRGAVGRLIERVFGEEGS